MTAMESTAAHMSELIDSLVNAGQSRQDAVRFAAIYLNEISKNPERDEDE